MKDFFTDNTTMVGGSYEKDDGERLPIVEVKGAFRENGVFVHAAFVFMDEGTMPLFLRMGKKNFDHVEMAKKYNGSMVLDLVKETAKSRMEGDDTMAFTAGDANWVYVFPCFIKGMFGG
jgi:hypothetical protein